MTSPHTHAATVEYFREKNHFGLPESEITFFQQGTLPCFDDDGKMIMKSRHEVATAPDGNGGLYAALHASGAIDDMRRRCVLYIGPHTTASAW
jgi:UDP-N-acetylglucosamine/UDP-N-acetylgalactosamine diphosphorylase